MATMLNPSTVVRNWDTLGGPQSQSAAEHQEREQYRIKRSPNRVKSKAAKPVVISSILESLGTLGSAQVSPSEEKAYTSDTRSERSRPHSVGRSVSGLPSLHRSVSHGLGVDLGDEEEEEEEDGMSEAALPPTVRTSRPPSGLSHYSAPRSPSLTRASPAPVVRDSPMRSRRSSFSSLSKDKTGYSKNKLSAESWVKQNSISQESLETNKSKPTRRSLRRIDSQDSLRESAARSELSVAASDVAESPTISRAEQIIAKASTPPPSKRRLYLTDSCSAEEQSVSEPPEPIQEAPEGEEGLESESPPLQKSVEEQTSTPKLIQDDRSSSRSSPRRNVIVDSIPTRTSSLRQSQTNSPVPGKKKERKSKRALERPEKGSKDDMKAGKKVDNVMDPTSNSKSISEASWADLGENDGTVKRIRQLQEQRKSRLLESRPVYPPDDLPPGPPPNVEANHTPAKVGLPMLIRRSEEGKHMARARPPTNRSSTEPPTKAFKILGITRDHLPPAINVHALKADNDIPDPTRYRKLSLEDKKPQNRPSPPPSPVPNLSLDYSYAEAVDALQGTQSEKKRERRGTADGTTPRTSSQVPRISAQYPGTEVNLVPRETNPPHILPVAQPRASKNQRRSHPDLPLDYDKRKNRRKSTSDARHTRQADVVEEAPPLPRRDSVEVAVTEYLQDTRLSRRIKHPLSGRVISFSEVGDRNGSAVFICVGMGLTRYVTAFYDELATTLRLRLITVDRPGVGGSEPYPPGDRSGPLSWPDDVLAICQYLGVGKFSLVAHSAGAIYALATALILPHLIEGKIHLLAPWIPPSQLEAISHATASASPAGALPRSQRLLRVLPTTFLKAANSSFMTATSASLKPAGSKRTKINTGKPEVRRRDSPSTPPSRGKERPASAAAGAGEFNRRESMMLMDQLMPGLNPTDNFPIPIEQEIEIPISASLNMSATATPTDPNFEYAANALNAAEHTEKERKVEYTSRLTQRTWELAVRDSNPATDLLVCLERNRDVGFKYTDVHREVVMTHGSEDKRVPLGNVKWLAEQMNRRAVAGDVMDADLEYESRRVAMQSNMGDGWDRDRFARGGCELRVLDGEGHGLMASPVIMGDVLTEIAGYWAGSNKARTTM